VLELPIKYRGIKIKHKDAPSENLKRALSITAQNLIYVSGELSGKPLSSLLNEFSFAI
jgi:hypothetical protein